jgi:hypothetical protein
MARQRREEFLGIVKKPSKVENVAWEILCFFLFVLFSIIMLCLVSVELRPWSVLELFALATISFYVAPFCYKQLKQDVRGRKLIHWLGLNPLINFIVIGAVSCIIVYFSNPATEFWRYACGFMYSTFLGLTLQLMTWSLMHLKNHPELYGIASLGKPLYAGLSEGIGIPPKRTIELLPGRSMLPLRKSTSFKTFKDDQEIVFLTFFFDEGDMGSLVAEYMISNIPKSAKGIHDYKVHLTIDEDRLLICSVDEPLTIIRVV